MYELFEDTNLPTQPVVKIGSIDLLKRTYQREVLKVVDYYGSRVSNVLNDHLLNRIITTACPPVGYDLQKFLFNAKVRAPSVADNFQLTFAGNYGKIHNGVFYGGAMEIILLDEQDFDEQEVYANWRDVDAVKVLTHPFTDYKLIPPFGQQYTDQKGLLVVLSLNISKLLVQFKGWVDSRRMLEPEERISLGPQHFIKMHVLPNILRSHVEFILYNRMKDQFYTLPNYTALGRTPFSVIDYSNLADEICKGYLERFQDQPSSYATFFQSIPGVFTENIRQNMMMPDEAKTKQVWWALFLTRLEDMFFAMHVGGNPGMNNNTKYINKFRTTCYWFLRDNTFKKVLSESIYSGYLSDMKEFTNNKM